jgi:hypothetical protein
MKQTLEQQIVKALTADDPPPTLEQLLTLVGEVESAIIEADNEASLAQEQFLDPIATPDANAGRAKMEMTQFTSARLRTLLPRLESRAREVEAEENRKAWQVRFDALERERDQLAAELGELYPKVESQLVSVFARCANLDARLSALHQSRPSGCKGTLLSAELVARNLTEFSRDQFSLTRELKIPSFTESSRLSWPPRETPAAVLLAESIASQGDPRRHSGEWYQVLAEDVERRKAEEAQRIADEQRRVAEDRRAYEASLPR